MLQDKNDAIKIEYILFINENIYLLLNTDQKVL